MCVAMIELAIDSYLLDEVLESEEIKLLWKETVVGTWMVDDIVSAKKELGEGFVENAIALGALETRNAQDGMDRAVQLARESAQRFEEQVGKVEARFRLVDKEGEEATTKQNLRDEVRKFVESCKFILTGSLSWR
jgi:Terpene synthase family 2, C-terminal metal binding